MYSFPAQNSNLVLQADLRLIERVKKDDASGEVMSLSGKLLGTRMGDKYQRSRPAKTDQRKAKRAKRDEASSSFGGGARGQGSLWDDEFMTGDMGGAILYRPKTTETRQTYEILLSFIQNAIGDQVWLRTLKRFLSCT
jgi:pre-mRNA-splicing helicase BRR2